MKIRVTGKKAELEALKKFMWIRFKDQIVSISDFYPNRGMSNEGRIYIETTTKEFMGFKEDEFALDCKL